MNNKTYSKHTYDKIAAVVKYYSNFIFERLAPITDILAYETSEHLRTPPSAELYRPVEPGHKWGGEWNNIWLHAEVVTPESAKGKTLCIRPITGACETLCFKNGIPSGIINGKDYFIGGMHCVMYLSRCAVPGERFTADFECYAGHECLGSAIYDNYGMTSTGNNFIHTLSDMYLCTVNEVFNKCVFDLQTVLQFVNLPETNFLRMKAHDALISAFPHVILDPINATYDEMLRSAERITEALAPALEKGSADLSRGRVGIVGHSHLDTAWLWPVSETVRKAARTYSEVLGFMDAKPDYKFVQSSSLHLDWMREYYPSIFERIKERVAEGRYEPNGGVWVECDCNITGGESMIRQFLYGQRFTRKHFGYTSDCFWLPDTFGYNAAIPQIMLGCDVKYFYTTKMDWNDLNPFPHDSFIWRGIDGSEVLTHLNQIGGIPDPLSIVGAVSYIKDKEANDMRLYAYGYGDGGGGPSYGMFEYIDRIRDIPGLPEIREMTVSEFMHELEERRDKLPVYDGELYLEFHRGTLTQMHNIKKNNRRAEFALRDLEYMNVATRSPRCESTDEFYKVMLKNQFHDILPGSSIGCVHKLATEQMTNLIASVKEKTQEYAASKSIDDTKLTLFNTLSFDRSSASILDGELSVADAPCQTYTDLCGEVKTAVDVPISAFGSVSLTAGARVHEESPFSFDDGIIETPIYTAKLDCDGYISYLWDKRARRQVLRDASRPFGGLMFGEDVSLQYDNWELDYDVFLKLSRLTASTPARVVANGEVELRIRSEYAVGRSSHVTVDTVFYRNDPRIDFEVRADWNEHHAILKAAFDADIRTTVCKNEIQFGHVERPTSRNDSLESAKFEICNHKWTDISESRYGVALLNDCKYGISVRDSEMMLTLHRGGDRPDVGGDSGVHTMRYSLLPHIGAFSAENVVMPAYELNCEPVAVRGELCSDLLCPVHISEPNIICESVKCAEDVPGAYVIRLYECERNKTLCSLGFDSSVRVYRTNMLEEIKEELAVENGIAEITFGAFEIVTLLVIPNP
ncbi:MAG: alpha-mannosidase [Clostridia bacterium]|nr:alpha-mannosidase [Clostridia bacterium]